jgi:hypothetical protein
MVRFEELQQLLQNQAQPQPPSLAVDSRGMAAALRRFRRRQYVINGIKLVVIAWAVWFVLSRPGLSLFTVLVQGLFLAGMITAMVTDWRIQSDIARLDFTRPSVGFLEATLERLCDPNAPFWRTGWLCMALLAACLNLMLAGSSATQTLPARIASHAAATFFPFAAFALGLKVRAKRYRPLVERLVAIKAALEEHDR